MTFHAQARRVRNSTLSLNKRKCAFRDCIGTFHWLLRQAHRSESHPAMRFTAIYQRYVGRFGLDTEPLSEKQLIQVIDALEAERNRFLERLHRFEVQRVREKTWGLREPSQASLQKLFPGEGMPLRDKYMSP